MARNVSTPPAISDRFFLTVVRTAPYNSAYPVSPSTKRRVPADQASDLIASRLSLYLRCLTQLDAAGVATVSSSALARDFHLNAAQIRKDLAYFGEFGVRGVGYSVPDLKRHLRSILGLDRRINVAVIGAGNLGLALADYSGFQQEGFNIVALFDTLDDKVGGQSRGGVPIHHVRDLRRIVARHKIRIAVIAVPASAAQQVANAIVATGIKAILNFSPGRLRLPDGVKLKNADLTVTLESLSFFLAREGEQ